MSSPMERAEHYAACKNREALSELLQRCRANGGYPDVVRYCCEALDLTPPPDELPIVGPPEMTEDEIETTARIVEEASSVAPPADLGLSYDETGGE